MFHTSRVTQARTGTRILPFSTSIRMKTQRENPLMIAERRLNAFFPCSPELSIKYRKQKRENNHLYSEITTFCNNSNKKRYIKIYMNNSINIKRSIPISLNILKPKNHIIL